MKTYKSQSWLGQTTGAFHEISVNARKSAHRSIQHFVRKKKIRVIINAHLSRTVERVLQLQNLSYTPTDTDAPFNRLVVSAASDALLSLIFHLSLCRNSSRKINPLPCIKHGTKGSIWTVESGRLCGGLVWRYSFKSHRGYSHPAYPAAPPFYVTTHLLVFTESGTVFGVATEM